MERRTRNPHCWRRRFPIPYYPGGPTASSCRCLLCSSLSLLDLRVMHDPPFVDVAAQLIVGDEIADMEVAVGAWLTAAVLGFIELLADGFAFLCCATVWLPGLACWH